MMQRALRSFPDSPPAGGLPALFGADVEKTMHLPLYNRYADKTQVLFLL